MNPFNKQRQEHNILALICGEKLKGTMSTSRASCVKSKTQMQILTRMDKVDIEDYYHVTIINKNV